MIRSFWLALILCLAGQPGIANARITVLMDVLRIETVVQILQEEGFAYAKILEEDMLGGEGGAFWHAQVVQIYDATQISEQIRRALEAGLDPPQIEAAIDFFATEAGGRIIELENAGRRAMADPVVEQAARDYYESQAGQDDGLLDTVQEFIRINDLLERNVSGAMSSNFQFYKGLSDGKLVQQTEADILAEVWAQQEDIRTDTEEWLNGFMLMAYQPLPAGHLQDYVTFSASPEGQALNAALFEGFEAVYRDVSYALGRAIALNSEGDEI